MTDQKTRLQRILKAAEDEADMLEACRLALQLIQDNWPEDHGCEQVGRAWGALENAIEKTSVPQPIQGVTTP